MLVKTVLRALHCTFRVNTCFYSPAISHGGPEALSESPLCNDMVADLHFPRFFGTAIKCEIARRFPRSVVKVGLHVQCKNISISSGVQP